MKSEQHIIRNCPELMRLDRYLRLEFEGLTQGLIEKSIRKGLIKVNEKKAKSSDRIKNGDVLDLKINVPTNSQGVASGFKPTQAKIVYGAESLAEKLFTDYLIEENEHFIIINKPSGLSSQSGTNVRIAIDDALNFMNAQIKEEDKINAGFRLVHRLDKDTSGLFIIAKNRVAATKLATGFQDKIIEKQYLAITTGCPQQPEGTIQNYLVKDNYNKIQMIAEEGDYAETDYKVIKSSGRYSIILFMPKTGRMHQIRVHSKEIGCPIVGDPKYGDPEVPGKKMLLHSYRVTIPKDIFGRKYQFEARMPDYFLPVLKSKLGMEGVY